MVGKIELASISSSIEIEIPEYGFLSSYSKVGSDYDNFSYESIDITGITPLTKRYSNSVLGKIEIEISE